MRAAAVIAPAALAAALAGCAAGHGAAEHVAVVQHAVAVGDTHSAAGAVPSSSAAMICGTETHASVQRILGLAAQPRSSSRWAGGIYTCTYHLPGGELVASVDDATDEAAGRRYFDSLRSRMPDLHKIDGVSSLGLPGYEDGHGIVLFLKDGKTLEVDATALPPSVGRYHQSPSDVAYGLAASVLACWSEH